MTDEELAEVLMQAYDKKPPTWLPSDDVPESRMRSRVRAHWWQVVRETRHHIESSQREQTAATILAALIERGRSLQGQSVHADPLEPGIVSTIREAVMVADLLRARLREAP